MKKSLLRLGAALLLACLLSGSLFVTDAEAALKKPTALRGAYTSDDQTEFLLLWKAVAGADDYQIKMTYSDNSHAKYYFLSDLRYIFTTDSDGFTGGDINGLNGNRIYKLSVRALKKNSKGKIVSKGAWSGSIFAIPAAGNMKATPVNGKPKGGVRLQWNKVYGAKRYRIYLTSNPRGKWYLEKTIFVEGKTAAKYTATIKKVNGAAFKYKTYYYRVLPAYAADGWVWLPPYYDDDNLGRLYKGSFVFTSK